jgi:hypothetical protein
MCLLGRGFGSSSEREDIPGSAVRALPHYPSHIVLCTVPAGSLRQGRPTTSKTTATTIRLGLLFRGPTARRDDYQHLTTLIQTLPAPQTCGLAERVIPSQRASS